MPHSSNNSLAQQQLITNGSSASTPAPPAGGVGEDSSAPSSLSVASSTAAESVVAVNQSKQPSKLNSQSMSQLNSHSETKVVSQGSRAGSPPKQHVANNGSTVTRSDMNIVSRVCTRCQGIQGKTRPLPPQANPLPCQVSPVKSPALFYTFSLVQ